MSDKVFHRHAGVDWGRNCPICAAEQRAYDAEAERDRLRTENDRLQRKLDRVMRFDCCNAMERLPRVEAERDRLRAALRNLLDAVATYTYASLGAVEDEAREALGDE